MGFLIGGPKRAKKAKKRVPKGGALENAKNAIFAIKRMGFLRTKNYVFENRVF